nr:MAG TPA: hypothetical protein [Caudoviricetes sp.]
MCKIIQFPKVGSNGYRNLTALFEICDSVESCNFYLESAERLYKSGNITENELYTLRRIGRQKRMELANPPQEPQKAAAPGIYRYTPEMGQKEPEGCRIKATRAYYGKHYFINTVVELKGRGITLLEQRDGLNRYQVTNLAFEKLKERYTISMECCLD